MLNKKTPYHYCCLMAVLFFFQGEKMNIYAEELFRPKSAKEQRLFIEEKIASISEESFPYIITRDSCLYLDKKNIFPTLEWKQEPLSKPRPCDIYRHMQNRYDEWVYLDPFRSSSHVLRNGRTREIWTGLPFGVPATASRPTPFPYAAVMPAASSYPPPFRMGADISFYNSCWNGDVIGFFSGELHLDNWEKSAVYNVMFYRGNIRVTVFTAGSPSFTEEELVDRDKYNEKLEQPLDPDPREIAWRIDQYLKGDPLEKLSDAEKAMLKTLEITLPNDAAFDQGNDVAFEQGKEYALDFPRKLTDGTVPAEIRLVVSRGEIQQVIDQAAVEDPRVFPNPASLAPDIDGQYTVLFGKPDKQTVHCYHINEEGQCLAWGEIEVFVKTPGNPESE